jgi:NitT/TauT family transport system substrate-binding protein
MIGISRGIPITCVAGGHIEGTVMVGKSGFASFQELGGDLSATLSQFKGRSIGCPKRGSIHDIIIRHYLSEYGLQEAVDVKNFDCAEFIADAMQRGDVEAGVATPCLIPYLKFFFSLYFTAKVLAPPYKLWPSNPSYGIFVRSDLAREEPETIEGFLETHEAATAYVRSQPEQAARIVAGVMEIVDEAYVTEAYKISPRYCAALPNEYISSTLGFVPVLRSLGYLKQELTQEEIFDLRFLKRIHPEPAHYHDEPLWSKV